MRIYVYRCIYDEGGAPCIDAGRLSLTICKPQIRRRARVGDLICAFGSNHESPANRLVYMARVTKPVEDGAYYLAPDFRKRGDCIYRRQRNGVFVLRDSAQFHHKADHRMRDLGPSPKYPRAVALVSDDFRYFGGAGTDDWKAMSPHLRKIVEKLGQGHRVNHGVAVQQELLALDDFVKREYRRKVNGQPLQVHGEREHAYCNPCEPSTRKRTKRVDGC